MLLTRLSARPETARSRISNGVIGEAGSTVISSAIIPGDEIGLMGVKVSPSVGCMRHSALALSRAFAAAALAHAMSLTVDSLVLRVVQQKSRDWFWPMDSHAAVDFRIVFLLASRWLADRTLQIFWFEGEGSSNRQDTCMFSRV